ncbi:MAG: hypothetical protein ABFQ64_05870 [Campylobacterota bacterium]
MSEELDFLRELGAQKIYEDTHISLKYAQSVIHESFEGLTRVQFLGFISILEREYNQDLSMLREKGLAYFEDEPEKDISTAGVFVEPKKVKSLTPIYILVALFVFIVVAFFSVGGDSPTPEIVKIDNSAIVNAQKNINPTAYEDNTSDENETIPLVVVEEEEAVELPPSLKIIAKTKLWVGYIDRTEDIKKQTIIEESLELDPSKEWLLSLGHGHVDILINGELQEFKTANNLRFLYKKGELKKLTFRDFKILNEGRVW